MWRSIASRSSLTRHLGRKLLSSHTPPSTSQVLPHKTLNPSSCTSHFRHPRKSPHQNHRFFSLSSIDEFETEAHDATSSSEDLELENGSGGFSDETHDVSSSHELELTPDFDGINENSDAHMSNFSSTDVGKLEVVLSLLQSSLDESLESKFDSMDLSLNEEFVVRVIETPLVLGDHLIRFFKWALGKNQFSLTTSILGSLTHAICNNPKRKDAYAMWDMVREIDEKEKGVVNSETLNQLISAFSKLGKGKAAFEVFGKFEELGCVPNSDTYYLTIEALCKRSFYDWAMSVCQKMLDAGRLPEREKVGEIISFFCKGRREKEAHVVYLAAKEQNKYPPQRSVNFLISCLSKVDETVHLAQEMLVDISSDDRKSAINPFSWVIRGLCRKKDIEGAKGLLIEMIREGPSPGNAVFNSVINCLSKSGDLEDAKEMLKLMESRGLKPDVYTYSVIMSGYAKGGLMEEACKVLSEAKKNHQKLCPATFHTLIRGYCKLGEFDKALKLMSEMNHYGVEANIDEYNKLIQTLCLKALDWETAEKLLEEMREKGLHLPGITRGLIKAVKELELEAVESEEVVAKA